MLKLSSLRVNMKWKLKMLGKGCKIGLIKNIKKNNCLIMFYKLPKVSKISIMNFKDSVNISKRNNFNIKLKLFNSRLKKEIMYNHNLKNKVRLLNIGINNFKYYLKRSFKLNKKHKLNK